MADADRVQFNAAGHWDDILNDEVKGLVASLQDEFGERIAGLREARTDMIDAAVKRGVQPGHLPPSDATTNDWSVPDMPAELWNPGIEISGPAHVTSMFINALNPGPEGERAEGDLDDDEDSASHILSDTLLAARNRKGAVDRSLTFYNEARDRHYAIQDGEIPFFMHRERGLHLDDPDLTVDGKPVSATILGSLLTLYHAGQAQTEREQGIYFYLPKIEAPEEATLYRELFTSVQNRIPSLNDATIRGILLVESLPLVWTMEESLHALGPYAAGLNAARWDLKASLLEYVMADRANLWPDRFGVAVPTTPFIANIFRRLVAVCMKHHAVPIGGMATALPHRDREVNEEAAATVRGDKTWEAEQGFLRGWVAHIYHMKSAGDPFKELRSSGWDASPDMANPDNYPVKIETPEGPLTEEGTRQNARTLIEYVEGWLGGRGAKGIDRLAGRPGRRPALMEDLATARISVAQMAQRVIHEAQAEDTGATHDLSLLKSIIVAEGEDIIRLLGPKAPSSAVQRYRDAVKVSMQWLKNYTEFNFRSLGSYSRTDLARIAAAEDAI
jgi:malate synthase